MSSQLGNLSLPSFSPLDWCLLIIIALSTLSALRRGFIRVLFSLAGFGAGLLIASWNYLRFATWLGTWITQPALAQGLAFLMLLVGVLVLSSILAGIFRSTASAVGLGVLDRLLGALFGFLRGVLVAAIAVMALVACIPDTNLLRESTLAGSLLQASHRITFVVPQHLQEQLAAGTSHLLQQSPKTFQLER